MRAGAQSELVHVCRHQFNLRYEVALVEAQASQVLRLQMDILQALAGSQRKARQAVATQADLGQPIAVVQSQFPTQVPAAKCGLIPDGRCQVGTVGTCFAA